jgi:cytochrome c553
MKPTLIALFALCAATSIARAQEVIVVAPATVAAARARAEADERALAERRQRMIDECIASHGYEDDCVREVDTELRAEAARVIHVRAPR